MPLPDVAVRWLTALAEKGNDQARRCYFSWALAGGAESPDWLKLEQWALGMVDATPGEAHAVLGMMYEPLLPGFSDGKVAAEHYRKAIEAGNVGCGLYLARVYLRQEGEAEIDYREIRALLELAEPVNPCGQLYAMLSSCCDQLGDAAAAMKYLKKLQKLAPDDAQCCLALARNYAMGCGTRLDYELALRCYQKAANLGDSYGGHGRINVLRRLWCAPQLQACG